MVRAGELSIEGRLDTQNIEQGARRVTNDMGTIENQARQTQGTFDRLGATTGKIASSLLKVGTVGVGALTGLATQSPAVAGHLADMRIQTQELSMTMGRSLEPMFESASEGLRSFTNFMRDNEDTIHTVSSAISNNFTNAMQGAKNIWDAFTSTADTVTKTIGIEDGQGQDLMGSLLEKGTVPAIGSWIARRMGAGRRGMLTTAGSLLGLDAIGDDEAGLGQHILAGGGTGAGIGTGFGLWGTAIGGGIGAFTGGTQWARQEDIVDDDQLIGAGLTGVNPFLGMIYNTFDGLNKENIKKQLSFLSED